MLEYQRVMRCDAGRVERQKSNGLQKTAEFRQFFQVQPLIAYQPEEAAAKIFRRTWPPLENRQGGGTPPIAIAPPPRYPSMSGISRFSNRPRMRRNSICPRGLGGRR